MAIPRFTPSDLGGQNFTHNPGTVASAIEGSFYRAQENVRQNAESARADERLSMQQQEQGVRMEELQYQQTLRPLREQSMQLGVAAQGLNLANQSVGLQTAQIGLQSEQMRLTQQQQEMQFLTGNLDWMSKQPPPSTSQGGVPTTTYSYGADAGGPDELQDKWTNQGYTSSGKNLTKGVVAVNTNKYPLGTIFRDSDTNEVFLAADRHGNKDQNVVDIFQDKTEYTPTKANRNLQVVGKVDKVPNTVAGMQQALQRFRNTDGTGVPSLTQVVSAKTPTGVPLVAAAANSLNPQEVIGQAFTDDQRQALARYDQLTALAQGGSSPQTRGMATQELSLMQNDPRMQGTLSQRAELVKTVQAQAQVQGFLQSAPDDMVKGFQARYASRYRLTEVDGRLMPTNREGQPLTSQDYASFSRAFGEYSTSYKYDPVAATADLRVYEAAIPKIAQVAAAQRLQAPNLQNFLTVGGEVLTPQSGKVYEQQIKAYNDSVKAYDTQRQQANQLTTELALVAGRNPQVAQAMMAMFPAQQAATAAGGTAAATAPRPSLRDLAAPAPVRDTESDDVWTEQKSRISQELQLGGFEDTGTASADNAALRLAAQLYEGRVPGLTMQGNIDKGAAFRQVLDVLGQKPGAVAFEQEGRSGSDKVSYRELTEAWAEDLLIKYGYLDPTTKRPVSGAAPAARANIKSITPKQ